MRYQNLHDLISHSSSSRSYFLSLPVSMQILLHDHNDAIHSAAELHMQAEWVQKNSSLLEIRNSCRSLREQ